MIEINDKKDCCGCHACYNICPKNAIEMIEDEKGFKYPKIIKERCINCGLCTKVCPIINNQKVNHEPKAYACYHKNDEIRKKSSSGGIFSLLAEEILDREGIVIGATFDDKYNVVHSYITKKEDLDKLRGSKYVQSSIQDIYRKVKEFLGQDKYVLFTGTPCQVEGLHSYLMKKYDKLYTQDIICHGVPSPLVWRKYLNYRKEIDKEEPKEISFRNKDEGWKKFNLKFNYKDKNYKKNQHEDLFMQAFLKNTILRESCYNCSFKKKSRVSDLTLADFWGIDKVLPEYDDNKGTSLVIVQSEKGKELLEKIKTKIQIKEVEINEAIKYNQSMITSVKIDTKRDKFFKNLDKMSFDKLVKKYTSKPNIIQRVKKKIKKIIQSSK